MNYFRVVLGLPGWDEELVPDPRPPIPHVRASRMRLAIELSGKSVARDVCCDEAAAVLKEYAERGSTLYNACQGE